MASTFSNVLSNEEIDLLLNMVEVNDARMQLTPNTNKVDFTMHLSDTVKQALLDRLGLNLQNVVDVPFRWIRGDTVAHADQAKDGQPFDNTYLMYLTDSDGTLDVDGQSYPIAKGAGYVFSEGLMHGTSSGGLEPRLMLGPMNNMGAHVGGPITPTIITVAGGNIYIRQGEYDIEYSLDQEEWYIIYWPCTIINSTPESTPIFVSFTTDITMLNNNYYFIVESESIFIGDIMLRPDGSRPIITIADSNAYPGLVQNGTSSSYGHNRIAIINLEIEARDSTLVEEAGWFAQAHYGGNAGDTGEDIYNTNYIVNCSTSAPIADNCGGIAGSNLAKVGGSILIVGCYTTGTIGENAGGIIGIHAGEDGGHVIAYRCFSSGLIGDSAGGIAGRYCGGHNGYIQIVNCYSTGEISIRGGGIVGMYCSTDAESQLGRTEMYQCYSSGAIGEDAGGIVGSTPGGGGDSEGNTIDVINCFSTGAISDAGFSGGIYGRSFISMSQSAQNCYTSGLKTGVTTGGIYGGSASDVLENSSNNYSEENNSGSGWSDSNAKSFLLGTPTTTMYGEQWCQPDGYNTPFKMTISWFSPFVSYVYLPQMFGNGTIEETIVAGEQTVAPGVPGFTYKLLQVNEEMPFNFPELSLNTETGAISTGISKDTRIYEIYIYSSKNPYSVTRLTLTATPSVVKECYAGNLCIKGKKFVGGNRDASAVISARTTKVLTNLKTIDPKQKSDAVNVQNRQQALTRVRGGGYMVPKKVTGKHLNQ